MRPRRRRKIPEHGYPNSYNFINAKKDDAETDDGIEAPSPLLWNIDVDSVVSLTALPTARVMI